MPIIFLRCRQQRGKMIGVVGNNGNHFSALWATKLKIFSALSATTRNNYYNTDYYFKNLDLT
jgi:hypothetical protein